MNTDEEFYFWNDGRQGAWEKRQRTGALQDAGAFSFKLK
jgi:hypothetical protein